VGVSWQSKHKWIAVSLRLGIITLATPCGRLIMTELVLAGNCGQDGSAD